MKSTSDAQRFADSRQLLDLGFSEIAKRDASRQTTTLQIVQQPNVVNPFQKFQVSAQIGGVSANYIAGAQWYVNGEAVADYGNSYFQITNGKTSVLDYTLDRLDTQSLNVQFCLTMADDTVRAAQTTLPVASVDLALDASLNLERADVYPGKTVTITADVTNPAALPKVTVPVQWELDGTAITNAPQTVTLENGHGQVSLDWTAPDDGKYDLTVSIGNSDEIELECELRAA